MMRLLIGTTLSLSALWMVLAFGLLQGPAGPGTSFFDPAGGSGASLFFATAFAQITLPHLALIALGLTLGARALRHGGRWTHGWFWLGLGLLVGLVVLYGALALDALRPGTPPEGWVLYPSAGAREAPGPLVALAERVLFPVGWALGPLSLGVVCLGILSTCEANETGRSLNGLALGMATVLFVAALVLLIFVHADLFEPGTLPAQMGQWGAQGPILGITALAALCTAVDLTERGSPYFCAGALVATAGIALGITVAPVQGGSVYSDTSYFVTHIHWVSGLFLVLVLFGVLDLWLRPRWSTPLRAVHALVLTAAVIAATAPQFFLGQQALPRRYIEHAESFALWQWINGSGAVVALVLVAAGVIAMAAMRTKAHEPRN